jgi:5,6-dimethylbenzimidazole synthase
VSISGARTTRLRRDRFPADFIRSFRRLLRWRRDVRHFETTAVPRAVVARLLRMADLAPSVGNSQPWRFMLVEGKAQRAAVRASFETANAAARRRYTGKTRARYGALKLAGLAEAPVHIAVFTDRTPGQGRGLGRRTMPETLELSTAMAIHTLWLAARCLGLGVGWVSIIRPADIAEALAVPSDWKLTAYLCLGYPVASDDTPELERRGWQARTPLARRVVKR